MSSQNWHECLRKFAKRSFIFYRTESGENIYTYEDVLQAADQLVARFQQEKLPIRVGFALLLHGHTPATCVLLLSIIFNNCHFCPLDPDLEPNAFQAHLLASGARYIITGSDNKHIQETRRMFQFSVFDEYFYFAEVSCNIFNRASQKNLCYTIGTSGSTGLPKIIHVPYECIVPNVNALSLRLQLSKYDVIFLSAPLTFDPFVIELFGALQNGAALIITTPKIRLNPKMLLQVLFPTKISQYGVTILQLTPSFFRLFGTDVIRKIIFEKRSSLRVLLLGGEEFPSFNELNSWIPDNKGDDSDILNRKRIFNIYGITEMSCWSTIYECNLTQSRDMRERHIPIGQSIDTETKLRIVDAEGNTIHDAGLGELYLGSSTRICYIPQLDGDGFNQNGEIFRNTGDLVQRDGNGNIYYIGRLNNTFKRSGKRICLDDLGKKIERIISNSTIQTQVLCLWDERLRKLLCILTECTKFTINKRFQKLSILERLSKFEKPDEFVYISKMPLNSHGKINRHELLKQLKSDTPQSQKPADILKRFLEETLGVNLLNKNKLYNDNQKDRSHLKKRQMCEENLSFIASGGTSFHAISLATNIGELLQDPADKHILMQMLLNSNVSINKLIEFLEDATEIKLVKSNCNLQLPLQLPPLASISKTLNLAWRVNLRKCVDATPVCVLNRYICIGSHSHLILTLDAISGQEVVRLELPDRIECQAEIDSSSLQFALVGCYDGHLYAFDFLHGGGIKWRINVNGMIKAKPLVCNETVIVGCYAEDFNLLCISLKTQQVIWRTKIGSKGIFSTPIWIKGLSALIACSLDGTYTQIAVCSGQIIWSHNLESPIFSTPALLFNEKHIVIAEVNGRVHICTVLTGDILNSFNVGGNIFTGISIQGVDAESTNIIFGCHDHYIYCLKYMPNTTDSKNLTLLWKSYLSSPIFATPLLLSYSVDNGEKIVYIIACSTKGLVVMLELQTGYLVATHNVKADIFSTPCCTTSGNNIYFGCRDNYLYCLKIQ